ncbi:MAG: hypothetical protein ACREMF_07880 [Gemmatimonadales bacterium]
MNRHPSGSTAAADDEAYLTWDLGGMVNLNPRSAIGATISIGSLGFEETRWALRPRYRRWLGGSGALDIEAGMVFGGSPNPNVQTKFPGFTGRIALNAGDWVALGGGVEVLRFACDPTLECSKRTSTDVAWYGGMKLASYPGTIVGVALPIAVVIAINSIDWY